MSEGVPGLPDFPEKSKNSTDRVFQVVYVLLLAGVFILQIGYASKKDVSDVSNKLDRLSDQVYSLTTKVDVLSEAQKINALRDKIMEDHEARLRYIEREVRPNSPAPGR